MPQENEIKNEVKEENDSTVEELLKKINEIKSNSVSKEDYERMENNNKKLIEEIASNRTIVNEKPKEKTREEILSECERRTAQIGKGNSLQDITNLCENYRAMKELKMATGAVDEEIVQALEKMVKEANGDEIAFKVLLENRIGSQLK